MFDKVEFDPSNPEPRCPCVLLLDTSYSMDGQPIQELNAGLVTFREDLGKEELTLMRVEVAIITFGSTAQLVQDFVTARQFTPPTLTVSGNTPMGEGINMALDLLDRRKQGYKANGLPYYRPWVFLVTDGAPTDDWKVAAQRVQSAEAKKKVLFFTVGVQGADMSILQQINPQRSPIALQGLAFRELFLWFSASMRSVSHANVGSEVPPQVPISVCKV